MTENDGAPSNNNSCPPILRGISAALGPTLLSEILSSKILLVGSGGIGCELLKNLALSGFRNVEIIDLDTIDVSNLNRQFLFRSHHVGMPKCVVASEAALNMVPPLVCGGDGGVVSDTTTNDKARYLPHHGNVCDNTKFNVPYIQKFALVLNALDNVAARRRVNRLCLAANVPLVEAGTAGYLGQVTVIDKQSETECYECQAKPTQKVYPICTIRSTPSQPVHCIVWAKELYKLCFGPKVEDSMLFEDEESLKADMEAAEKEKEGGGEGEDVKSSLAKKVKIANGKSLDDEGKSVTSVSTMTKSQVGTELMKAEGVPLSCMPSERFSSDKKKSNNSTELLEGWPTDAPADDGRLHRPLNEDEMRAHKHERWAMSAPNVDLSGEWTLIADDSFKAEYDAYLKQLGFNGITRKVACSLIARTTEETKQIDNGRELYLKGTNPKGAWERTLTASGYPDFETEADHVEGEDYNHHKTSIKTADSEDVDAEAWWEEKGTKHRSVSTSLF